MEIKNYIALPLLVMLTSSFCLAEYKISIPIQTPLNFVEPGEPENPQPEVPENGLEKYKGIGTIDSADGSGFLESSTFQNEMYRSVLLRSFGDHTIWLHGKQQELLDTTSSITFTLNGDVLACEIYDARYNISTNETTFSCSTSGFDGTKYSVGQQFNVKFN